MPFHKLARLFGQYLLAIGVLALVLYKAQHQRIAEYLWQIEPFHLLLAFLLLNVAQVFNALRMRYYFAAHQLDLSRYYSLVLYYVGLFFNFIFPGGIGGDAYRVYMLKKLAGFSLTRGVKLMLANRANGVVVLIVIALGLSYFIETDLPPYLRLAAITLLILASVYGYLWAAQFFLGETMETAWGASKYSVLVQAANVLVVITLWHGLGAVSHVMEYIILFLFASIMAVLPISVGGLGIRELTFFYGASLLQALGNEAVDTEFGVALSLSYFAIYTATAFIGVYWVGRVTKLGATHIKHHPAAPKEGA